MEYLKNVENHVKSYDDGMLFEEMFKATGKTTRLVDELIQEFFEKPAGTEIPVVDHHPERRADEFLLEKFLKRLESEHPGTKCDIRRGTPIIIQRGEKTYHEIVREEFKNRKENGSK